MGPLTFAHPWLLVGLPCALLPLLIHLIGQRRAPVVRFAAFDFLSAVNQQLARRERWRQLLLLILRTLALACVVVALARPMPRRPVALPTTRQQRVAMIIDTSASMAYVRRGASLLEQAQRQAHKVLSGLSAGDAVALIFAGNQLSVPFQVPTQDHAAVRAAIDQSPTPDGVADFGSAITQALKLFPVDGAEAELVVISDLAANSFAHLNVTAAHGAAQLRLVDAAERASENALANLAVVDVGITPSGQNPQERRFEVTLHNWGDTRSQSRSLELWINQEMVARGYVEIEPHAKAQKVLTYNFAQPGVYRGRVHLEPTEGDGYQADDDIDFAVEVAPAVRVLVINGEPRTTPYDDELFFLERALEAVPQGEPYLETKLVTIDEFAADAGAAALDLSGFDVAVLANVATLPAPGVARLRDFVASGAGLLFTLGAQVQFESANALWGDLLPHPLRDVYQAEDPAAAMPGLGWSDVDWNHPIFHLLGVDFLESLRAGRTRRYFNLDVGAGQQTRVLARFDNGAPALVEQRRQDAGRVVLLTTSIDVDWGDLPLRTAFPALLQRTLRYLGGATHDAMPLYARSGRTVEINLPTGAASIALISPAGQRITPVNSSAQAINAHQARFAPLHQTGWYGAQLKQADWRPEPRLDVAVNAALDESDFTPVKREQIAAWLTRSDGERAITVIDHNNNSDPAPWPFQGLASALLGALALFFIVESLLAWRG